MEAVPEIHPDTDTTDGAPRRSFDWLPMLWRRKPLLILGIAVGLVIGTFTYFQKTPIYQSRSQVMVIKKSSGPFTGQGADPRLSFYEDYLSTHLVLIKSPIIVQKAVEKYHLRELKSFQATGDPTGVILSSLTPVRDTTTPNSNNILNLSYSGTDPEDTAVVLKAVIESYKDFLDEAYKNVSDETLAQITRATEAFQKNLDVKEKEYAEFRKKSPLIYWKGTEGASAQDDLLSQIHTKRLALIMRKAEIQGRIDTLAKAQKQGRGREVLLAQLTSASSSGTAINAGPAELERKLDEQLFELETKEQTLLADFGPDHPDVVAVRKRMALTREYFKRGGQKQKEEKGEVNGSFDRVEWYARSLRQEQEDVEATLKSLNELAAANEQEAREAAKLKEEDKHFRDDIARAQQSAEPIIKRLEEIRLVREMGGYDARLISPPGRGGKVSPVPTQFFLLSGILGLLGGVGLAYLAEISDRSFRTPDEIRRHLSLPVVGHIPVLTPDKELDGKTEEDGVYFDPSLMAYFQPKSLQAEAFRGIRTALYFSTHGEEHKVIQVTSPNPGDGKSTMIANLAISMAQSGKKVLLIDADCRKPRQQKLFRLFASTGLASVISGQTSLPDATHPTEVEGLSLLPCGPRPENPAELLTSPRFKEVVEQARGQYDFVLIDTPPLLAVSDPSIVAPRVDGVLLTIRLGKNARVAATRARDILNSLGVNVLGVIVNGVGRQGGDGYGYGYGYNYGYTYGYSDKNGYYEDAAEEEDSGTDSKESEIDRDPMGEENDVEGSVSEHHLPVSTTPRPSSRQTKSRRKRPTTTLLQRLWPWNGS